MISVSIISHAHGHMVKSLILSLLKLQEVRQIIVTLNVPELLDLPADERIITLSNPQPKGFGANHNAAFSFCDQPYFCPLNPDISLTRDPFPTLFEIMARSRASLVAPLVVSPAGDVEDSARRFPSLHELLLRPFGGVTHKYPLQLGQGVMYPDWVGGMFMLFTADGYAKVAGFDESFYLYYEDVDICTRLWESGLKIALCTDVQVIHDARRASRSNLRHLRWHLCSLVRYYLKHWGRLPRTYDPAS